MKRYQLILLPLGLLLIWDFTAQIAVEMLWFQELGYLSVFLLRIKTQLGLGTIALLLSGTFFWSNFALASRNLTPKDIPKHSELKLRWLLPIVIALGLVTHPKRDLIITNWLQSLRSESIELRFQKLLIMNCGANY